MRKLITLALLVCASATAQARLGETEAQIMKRFGADALISRVAGTDNAKLTFGRKNLAVILLDHTGRSRLEIYLLNTPFAGGDLNEIVRTVLGGTHWRWYNADDQRTISHDGAYEFMVLPRVKEPYLWGVAVGNTGFVDAFASGATDRAASPQPAPVPRVPAAGVDPDRTPNDCGIIAAQAYAKLKPAAYWCQIVAIKGVWQDTRKSGGHALVLYKYQSDGNVFVYDERGALPLPTASQNLDDLKPAIQTVTPDCSIEAIAFVTH